MNYVCVFLGEFGFELLAWHGVVRKLSKTLSKDDTLICCSRASLYPLYECADRYIDISELDLFKKSIACMYWGRNPTEIEKKFKKKNWIWDKKLKQSIRTFVLKKEGKLNGLKNKVRNLLRPNNEYRFIFSSEENDINGIHFGLKINCSQEKMKEVSIYSEAILRDNEFKQISPVLSLKNEIEKKLGFSLDEPYILCQTANREIIIRSTDKIPKEDFISSLAKEIRVVLLNFNTKRNKDSFSSFKENESCFEYSCKSFPEQSCLIHYAKKCVFFTEGDYRSHTYIPPFLGKDVIAIAPKSVFALKTTPIDFWNRYVFKFGGQMIPFCSEEIFADRSKMEEFKNQFILAKKSDKVE